MSKNLYLTKEPQYRLLDWSRSRCGVRAPTWSPESEAVGVMDGDRLRAVVVFNAFQGDACMAHIASDHTQRWATRNILGGLFGYAFIFKRMRRLMVSIPACNRAALIVAIKLGFQFEGLMRQAGDDGDDLVCLSMLAHECPWIRERPAPIPDATRSVEADGSAEFNAMTAPDDEET